MDGDAVLQIADTAIDFSAAPFLDSNGQTWGQSVKGTWLLFFKQGV